MIKRVSTLVMMLVVLITSQCYATQPRIANIGAEMFRQKFMENNKTFVSEFLPKDSAQKFIIPGVFPNSTSYVFLTSEERNGVIIYSNQEGYVECVVVMGLATSTQRNIQLMATAMKAAMSLSLDNDEISWLFSEGTTFDRMYMGVVHCKSSNRDIYLTKTILPNGTKAFCFDHIPASVRFSHT